jgi:thiol-disulfide isomerase/thioredoxin
MEAIVRSAVLTLSLLCLISLATAQEPEHDPADPYWASFQRRGTPHHEEMIGQFVPDVTFVGADGKEVALSSYRGRPLLIDFWATWCAPCLAALPSLNRIYAEFKGKGLEVISLDQDRDPARATNYLAQHHYEWKNSHDGARLAAALQSDGVPLAMLVDANGKIVYCDFGSLDNEAYLRKAIAGLGPEFAPPALPNEGVANESKDAPNQN